MKSVSMCELRDFEKLLCKKVVLTTTKFDHPQMLEFEPIIAAAIIVCGIEARVARRDQGHLDYSR